MKRMFSAAVIAVACASAAPAYAANFILTDDFLIGPAGPQQSNFYIETVTGTQIDASIRRPGATGAIDDNYFFAPLVNSFGTGSSITSNATVSFGTPGLIITAFTLNAVVGDPIYDALVRGFTTDTCTSGGSICTSGNYFTDSNLVAAASVGPGVYSASATDFSDPQSRTATIVLDPAYYYKINITGNVSTGNGQYNGNLTSNVVPEPATWAMMLVGFGAIGFAMRRRRSPQPKVRFAF